MEDVAVDDDDDCEDEALDDDEDMEEECKEHEKSSVTQTDNGHETVKEAS